MHRNTHAFDKMGLRIDEAVMIDELELRQEIAKAVRGDVSLNALYSWLMARSWNMHKDSNPAALELANSVEDLFFDKSDGIINDGALLQALAALLGNDVVSIEFNEVPLLVSRSASISEAVTLTARPSLERVLKSITSTNAAMPLALPLSA